MKKYIIFIMSIVIITYSFCKNGGDNIFDDISEYILVAEVTNRQMRNMVVDNAAQKLSFELANTESKTGVNIKLTLADGVTMVSPKQEQANYDLIYPAEIKLSVGGRTIVFTVRTSDFVPSSQIILAAEVTNRQTRNIVIKNNTKEITFNLANTEPETGVNIKLTLADGVSMISPATTQADYDFTKPVQIELLADNSKVLFTIKADKFEPQPPPQAEKLVIGIWVPPPPHLIETDEDIRMRYKQIADAGINMTWGNHWPILNMNEPDNKLTQILDVCLELGLGFLPYLGVSKSGVFTDAELNRHIHNANQYKDHPAVIGFALNDEPSAIVFDRMSIVRREVDAILPEGKYTVANLFPNHATVSQLGSPNYEHHVDHYMSTVQPKILSFDHYPLYSTTDVIARQNHDRIFVANLITIRNAALKYNVPFWGFIQALGYVGHREPTMDEYRWLCHAHTVFGAKGFSYFIYAAVGIDGGTEALTGSMLTWDGKLTFRYDYAKNINTEFSGFSHAFMPFTQDGFLLVNQNTQMEATIPMNLRRTSYGNLSKIETTGEMINGCFDLNGQKAVYLFNWSKDKSMSSKLTFNGIVNFQLWGKDGLESEQSASELNVSFVPGEAKFLMFL